MAGRPPEWPDCVDKAQEYINGDYKMAGDVVPTVAGLAIYLGKSRETMYAWAKEHDIFSDIIRKLLSIQENRLINGGLAGDMNSTITKLLLSKHGYSDKQETEITGKDGGPLQVEEVKRTIVDPKH